MVNSIKTVTLVGAGKMGVKIAARAAIFGFAVRVYDVSPDAVARAGQLGARIADSPADRKSVV